MRKCDETNEMCTGYQKFWHYLLANGQALASELK